MDGFLWFLLAIGAYLLGALPMYKLAVKADYSEPVFAFIPILNGIMFANVAGISGWTILLMLVPFVNIGYAIYVVVRFYGSFESGGIVLGILVITGIIGAFIPFAGIIGLIAIWWLAFSNKAYVGDLYYA